MLFYCNNFILFIACTTYCAHCNKDECLICMYEKVPDDSDGRICICHSEFV